MPVQASIVSENHQIIDLSYIEQVSNGDKAFEKEIVQIFIEQIPQDLALLNTHFEEGNFAQLRQSTHYMLPSISILGLETKLKTELEALGTLDSAYKILGLHVKTITEVCNQARAEAISLLHTYA